MKGKLYLLSALLLLYSPIFAQQVSLETAQRVANMFLQNNVPAAMRSASATNTTTSSVSVIKPIGKVAQSPVMYAISQDSVWVLVSADERVTPILAYSDANAGMFPEEDDMPDGMIALLEWYEEQIQYLRDSTTITTIHEGWQTYQVTSNTTENEIIVSPLLYRDGEENVWKQSGLNSGTATVDKCYNKFCPLTTEGKRSIVGCVAVAMGQLMWYWQWPEIAVVEDDDENTLIREYNWDYMPAKLRSTTPVEHIDMVANLLHDAGVSVNMTYTDSASSANSALVPSALRSFFSYNSDNQISRSNNNSNWIDLLKENLDKGYPILYSGRRKKETDTTKTIGHQFVIDGYDSSNAFHINYGWGHSNAYYVLDTIPGVRYRYYLRQSAIFNVHPNYPDCSPREITQSEMWNTKFVVQNGGGITIGGDIVVESNQEGVIYSGEYVKLTNGFHAKAGSNLRIAIKDMQCGELQAASLMPKRETSVSKSEVWCNAWNVLSHGFLEPDEDLYKATTNIYQLGQDTVIENQVYSKLTYYSSKSATKEQRYVGALRFTKDKKVYIHYDNTEYLLYDFDVQIGDTLEIFGGTNYYSDNKTLTHIITDIDTLNDGRLHITSDVIVRVIDGGIILEEDRQKQQWIEGVGSIDGIVQNNATLRMGNFVTVLLCAYNNDECCYTTDNPGYTPLGCVYNEGDVINAVEDVSISAPSVQKIIKESQLLILRDGKMYNIMGVEVGE